ncbi:MAG: hypothetical protein ACRBBW_13030 [Cellvibrionaceae bacterium]
MIRNASLAAYIEENDSGKAAQDRCTLLRKINQYPGVTRKELSEVTGMPINVVTPRIRELLDSNTLKEDGCARDPLTRRPSNLLYLNLSARDLRGSTSNQPTEATA